LSPSALPPFQVPSTLHHSKITFFQKGTTNKTITLFQKGRVSAPSKENPAGLGLARVLALWVQVLVLLLVQYSKYLILLCNIWHSAIMPS
jgi:hypothetical protein